MNKSCLYGVALVVFVTSLLLVTPLTAQQELSTDRDDYVSDASYWMATFRPAETDFSTAQMAEAATGFIETLDDQQRGKLMFDLRSEERRKWTNLPSWSRDTEGLRLGDLNQKQVEAACQLIATLMSKHGYKKMRGIMLADDQLLSGGRARDGFGTENYFLCIFGKPSATDPWAFQLDGHHIGANVSVTGDNVTLSPSFIGTQPQNFKIGDLEMRPLTGEIDDAYAFVNSLNDEQRKVAVTSAQKGRIFAGPGRDGRIPDTSGLNCSDLNDKQKEILFRLIDQWISDLPPNHAAKRTAEVQSELAEMFFSWNGEIEVGSDISYRIQSPSLIIEYACQNMGGDSQQHLHSMYRNPKNEYAGQLKQDR